VTAIDECRRLQLESALADVDAEADPGSPGRRIARQVIYGLAAAASADDDDRAAELLSLSHAEGVAVELLGPADCRSAEVTMALSYLNTGLLAAAEVDGYAGTDDRLALTADDSTGSDYDLGYQVSYPRWLATPPQQWTTAPPPQAPPQDRPSRVKSVSRYRARKKRQAARFRKRGSR
jgi:hypothetical protein